MKKQELAQMIDHTLLKPDCTKEEIEKLCQEAIEYNFKGVCIESKFIPLAVKLLEGKDPLVITVVGFPTGEGFTEVKVSETLDAYQKGAQEIDMVINMGWLKSKDYKSVFQDIDSVVKAAKELPVKVILETCLLNNDEKIIACALAKAAGASFVKTSSGFSHGGATPSDVALMKRVVGSDMGVKASGGIKTYSTAMEMIRAGADRLGTSASIAIIEDLLKQNHGR